MSVKVRPYRKGGWEADIVVRLTDGTFYRERRKAPGTSKLDARTWGRERERFLIQNGRPNAANVKKEVPTLEQFQTRFIDEHAKANRQKPSTIVSKESIFKHHLVPVLGSKRLDEIRDADIQQLKGKLAARKPKTVNNVLTVLNKMLRTAVRWGVIEKMPVAAELVKAPGRQMSFYEDVEYERLITAASGLDQRILLTVLLGGEAGMRAGEIIALEQADVDWERSVINIQRSEWRKQVTVPKGGHSRRVPLTKRLAAALKESRHLRGPRVLYQDDGRTTDAGRLRDWMEQAQRLAGLRATGAIHILRHTFCSRLAMRGAPAKAIQELAGHAYITTTMRYMHLSPAAKENAVRLLDEPRSGDSLETKTGRE